MTACVFVATERVTGKLYACKLAERKPQRNTWSRLVQLRHHESNLLQEIGCHPHIVRFFVSCLWERADASNPNPSRFVPVQITGFNALHERRAQQLQAANDVAAKLAEAQAEMQKLADERQVRNLTDASTCPPS